ncbi:MAG: class I SAM-dependent methyltransferase, partial [Methanospirillum sp.]|nr:class I SAM-dependent methyltransferase [Methanospirillum sp.]
MHDTRIKGEISGVWDTYADTYDSFVSHGIQTEEEKKLWINVFLKNLPRDKEILTVLDVGCGTGAIGLILAEMGHNVTGLDLSEKMMEEGRQKAVIRRCTMRFLPGDVEDPPFPDNEFDVVISRHLLWTLPHPVKALTAWKRIIRPGGRVMVIAGIWNDGTLKTRILKRSSELPGRIFDPTGCESLT